MYPNCEIVGNMCGEKLNVRRFVELFDFDKFNFDEAFYLVVRYLNFGIFKYLFVEYDLGCEWIFNLDGDFKIARFMYYWGCDSYGVMDLDREEFVISELTIGKSVFMFDVVGFRYKYGRVDWGVIEAHYRYENDRLDIILNKIICFKDLRFYYFLFRRGFLNLGYYLNAILIFWNIYDDVKIDIFINKCLGIVDLDDVMVDRKLKNIVGVFRLK